MAPRCSLWAGPGGADTNAGSRTSPFLTVGKLAASLAPGQTGCLPAGSAFPGREVITALGSAKGRVTITTGPGRPRAILLNGIETTQKSRYLTLTNLTVKAGNGALDVPGTVVLRGFSTALTHSEVGPGALKEAGRSCVVLDHAGSARVDGNVLHDCNGDSPGRYGAGVLAATSAGARIVDNIIFGNDGGDGLAFSPNAQFSVARRNLIVDNLGSVYFGGSAKTASRGNVVEENVFTRSERFDVHSAWTPGGPVGNANVVRKNCIWSPAVMTAAGTGFAMSGNRKLDPRVVKSGGRYRLARSSPCLTHAASPSTSVYDILFG